MGGRAARLRALRGYGAAIPLTAESGGAAGWIEQGLGVRGGEICASLGGIFEKFGDAKNGGRAVQKVIHVKDVSARTHESSGNPKGEQV